MYKLRRTLASPLPRVVWIAAELLVVLILAWQLRVAIEHRRWYESSLRVNEAAERFSTEQTLLARQTIGDVHGMSADEVWHRLIERLGSTVHHKWGNTNRLADGSVTWSESQRNWLLTVRFVHERALTMSVQPLNTPPNLMYARPPDMWWGSYRSILVVAEYAAFVLLLVPPVLVVMRYGFRVPLRLLSETALAITMVIAVVKMNLPFSLWYEQEADEGTRRGAIVFAAMLVADLLVLHLARRQKPVWPNVCGECEYDLTGNISGICPECGAAIARERSSAVPVESNAAVVG